ncbi:connector enhancer of kinase suppressor of ras 2-like [Diadema setosum]|uniref:connector enhancer of kinase suppressor of ras 2-like n=1 Tax=Diadema setosum TaxID=31175 RepID=UPI003B3B30D4
MEGFINIPHWSAKDVADWMKGLDSVLHPYIKTVLTRKVTGDRLLLMTAQDLEELDIEKVGHQEIMLDAINLLCNLHYRQSVEDLQSVTLNLNTRTNCLVKFLQSRSRNGSYGGKNDGNQVQSLPASILVLVAEIVTAAKTVISWLDRPPFVTGEHFFNVFREDILKSALELTHCVQQTGSLPELEGKLLEISQELGQLSDDLVKKGSDPLIIQTSTIDFVSIKKKRTDEELGLEIRTSAIDGTHLITCVKPTSAAGATDKVHIGDEILQVDYQTVVGWQHNHLIDALRSNHCDITLTLKKRPKHLSQPGQIQRPKQNPFLHPHIGLSSLPYRRPSGDKRRMRVAVRDDLYLPNRESEKQEGEEEGERPPDTPSELPESPLDSPLIDIHFPTPRGFPQGRRPTMVPGMALSRRRGLSRQGRPRSLPSSLDEISKELDKSLGMKNGAPQKIKPLPANMKFPTSKTINGNIWDTEPIPVTPGLEESSPASRTEEDSAGGVQGASDTAPPSIIRRGTTKSKVSFNMNTESKVEDAEKRTHDDNHHGNQEDEVDGPLVSALKEEESRSEAEAEAEAETAVQDGCEDAGNKNNNEGNQIPKELGYLLDVVEDISTDDTDGFVHVSIDDVDKPFAIRDHRIMSIIMSDLDRPAPIVTLTKHPSNVSSISTTTSLDSTDGVVRRHKKAKMRVHRGVSCVDIGPGECQGFLFKKTEKAMRHKWTKMWFVLKEFVLYYFKDQKAEKAKGVICLPGFQVKAAPECNRSHAFKVTHEGTKDIFLAGSDERNMRHWMEKLQLATIMLRNDDRVRQSTLITDAVISRLGSVALTDGYASESTDEESRKGSIDILNDGGSSISDTDSISQGAAGQTPTHTPSTTRSEAAEALANIEGEAAQASVRRRAHYFITPDSSRESSPAGSPDVARRGQGCSPGVIIHFKERMNRKKQQQMYELKDWEKGGEVPFSSVDGSWEQEGEEADEESEKRHDKTETNTDDLVKEWKKINNVTVDVLNRGTSFRAKRKERPSIKITKKMSPKEEKSYEKNMLLRKLKAKQAELDSVERLLRGATVVTSEVLQEWKEQNEDLLRSINGTTKDHVSSDSDPESSQELHPSSSMSSINTTSTTTSAQESAALCEDTTPVSDGTTSGCDVQTPLSDTVPAIGDRQSDGTVTAADAESALAIPGDSSKLNLGATSEDGDSAIVRSEDEKSGETLPGELDLGLVRPASMRSESEASETSL